MERMLLFIPMYNCEKQIVRVLDQLKGKTASYFDEVILVNNQSTDHGEEAAMKWLQENSVEMPVTILKNRDNYGLGGSHKVAIRYALEHGFTYLAVLHGDDQGELSNLEVILKRRIYEKYDCCLGARFIRGSKLKGYSLFRTLGNHVYNFLFSAVLGRWIYDLGSGLNLYRVSIFEDGFQHKFPDNLTFNCYMLFAAKEYGHRILFFPIVWKEEDQVSNVKMVRQACDTFLMAVRYWLGRGDYLRKEFRKKEISEYESDPVKSSEGGNSV